MSRMFPRPGQRRPAAFTLIEVIVAVFIGTLLFTAAVQLMTATSRLFTRVRAHVIVQSGGQIGVGRFAEDVKLASPRTLSIYTAGLTAMNGIQDVVAFAPQDATGTMISSTFTPASIYVIYYYDPTLNGGSWVRGTWINPTNAPFSSAPLTAPQISAILQPPVSATSSLPLSLSSAQVLTQNVSQIQLTPGLWPAIAPPYTLDNTLLVDNGVHLELTVRFQYAAVPGFQNVVGEFTDIFTTEVRPRGI